MDWEDAEKQAAREWLATTRSMDLVTEVVVARRNWRGWPSDARQHTINVMVEGAGAIWEFEEEAFEEATRGRLAQPVLTWGYADRPALGAVASRSAMLARSFPDIGLIRPLVVVAFDEGNPNTAPAYFERGIELVPVPEDLL